HQSPGTVRLRRPVGWWLVTLCRAGEAAAADRLAAGGVRTRLEPSAATAEFHLLLLRAHRSVALRDAERRGHPVADRATGRLVRFADRLQRTCRTHGLAALGAATEAEPAECHRPGEGCRSGAEGLCRTVAAYRRTATLVSRPRRSG